MMIRPDIFLKELVCLYVEDDASIREPFSMLIQRYFKEVIVATNGREGLALYSEHEPDIIISDIRMPVMDGLEMVQNIREDDNDVFIVFITAFSDIDYLKKAIDLGVDGYLTKPIDKQKLILKLNKLAEYIKQKKEIKEYIALLKDIFDKQLSPTILMDKSGIKLKNKAFKSAFPNINNLAQFNEMFDIDYTKKKQEKTVEVNGIRATFEILIQQTNNELTLVILNDISEFEEEILTDQLTKLYNRKIIERIMTALYDIEVYVIMLDIDNFKMVNDTYGHDVGDAVLAKIAEVLKTILRKNDIIVRWGGEEFVIILDSVPNIEITKTIANTIREKIEATYIETVEHITCSFGVCGGNIENEKSFDELLKKADEALYKAKKNGKNRVEVCS